MVDLVVVPRSGALDEVRVYFENVGAGKGYVTLICWGAAWTAYFGGMGEDNTIQTFIRDSGVDYLSNKMHCDHFKDRKSDREYLKRILGAIKSHLRQEADNAVLLQLVGE